MTARPDEVLRPDVLALSAYHVPPAQGMIKLDAMENPYGLPEPVRREIAELVYRADINRYPDPTAPALRSRLREVMRIPDGQEILLGNGSDELIYIMSQSAARPGASVLAPGPTFVMYSVYAALCGMRYIQVPLREDFSLDTERFLETMAAQRPALVFLSYPNNPTGNAFSEGDVERIIAAAPGLVVLDEAYHAFCGKSFLPRLERFANLVVLRTLSKLGLAGVRMGYAVGRPEWIREFDKVRSPYNVGSLAQLVAERVLAHHALLDEQAARIRAERERLQAWLGEQPGVRAYPSEANFILVRVAGASRVFEAMKRERVLVKHFAGHPRLDSCLRLTVGTPEENEQMRAALGAALRG